MDIGAIVHGQNEKEKESGKINIAEQIVQVQADLRDANQLIDALKDLDDFFAWNVLRRVLIDPMIDMEKKMIDRMNKELQKHPENINDLIGHNAFLKVLTIVTDFQGLRKQYGNNVKILTGRLRELEKLNK